MQKHPNVSRVLKNYMHKPAEMMIQWQDPKSSAKGILVINQIKNGACGGGTRVSLNTGVEELTQLAKIMELKFSLVGPVIGGAKSGIVMDPNDSKKHQVLERWFKAIRPVLYDVYGTASDLNTDFKIIQKQLQALGIPHSQYGIINALQQDETKIKQTLDRMHYLNKQITLNEQIQLPIAQMITGYMIAEGIAEAYRQKDQVVEHKNVFVQGMGTVGSAVAYYLNQLGANVIALLDKDAGFLNKEGATDMQLLNLMQAFSINKVFNDSFSHKEFYQHMNEHDIHIFVPAAGSHLVTETLMYHLLNQNLEVMMSGANIPFSENELYGPIEQVVDQKITLIPSFVASGGMARAFNAVIQSEDDQFNEQHIFKDAQTHIQKLLKETMATNPNTLIAERCYQKALGVLEMV